MRRKQHGGKRTNAGRKPIKDKKVQVNFYPRESKIEQHGGLDGFKAYVCERAGIDD